MLDYFVANTIWRIFLGICEIKFKKKIYQNLVIFFEKMSAKRNKYFRRNILYTYALYELVFFSYTLSILYDGVVFIVASRMLVSCMCWFASVSSLYVSFSQTLFIGCRHLVAYFSCCSVCSLRATHMKANE